MCVSSRIESRKVHQLQGNQSALFERERERENAKVIFTRCSFLEYFVSLLSTLPLGNLSSGQYIEGLWGSINFGLALTDACD